VLPIIGRYAKLPLIRRGPCRFPGFPVRGAAPAPRTHFAARAAPGGSFKLLGPRWGDARMAMNASPSFIKPRRT
jgi:hypothetical protein